VKDGKGTGDGVKHVPQTMINKAINNLRKHANACVLADGGHFDHIM